MNHTRDVMKIRTYDWKEQKKRIEETETEGSPPFPPQNSPGEAKLRDCEQYRVTGHEVSVSKCTVLYWRPSLILVFYYG